MPSLCPTSPLLARFIGLFGTSSPWRLLGQMVFTHSFFRKIGTFWVKVWSRWGQTNLVLICKVAHPELITQFRPISLCNTLYKLVSRILVQRLKPYMAEIINPYQASFVLGRRTSDNFILVQEVIWTLKYWRGRTGYVAIKLDLKKAYDRLEWSFIKETLEFFQLPPNLITLIMNTISSTRCHILWNGAPLPEVVPSRGVR